MPDYFVQLELQRLRDAHVVLMAEHRHLIESPTAVLEPEHLARLDEYLVRLERFLRTSSERFLRTASRDYDARR